MKKCRSKRLMVFVAVMAIVAGMIPSMMITAEAGTGDSWTSGTSGISDNLYGVCYGGGTFVAVGAGGTIITSTNGVLWETSTSGTTSNLYSVSSNGSGTFVAVGAGGTVVTSNDSGLNWTQRFSDSSYINGAVSYGSGTFVAFFDDDCYTSSDGTVWSYTSSQDNYRYIYGLCSESDTFIGVGAPDPDTLQLTFVKSVNDGSSWSTPATTFTGSENLNSVCSGGTNGFVAVGDGGRIFRSSDGDSWVEAGTYTTGRFLNGASYGGTIYAAVGEDSGMGVILTSNGSGSAWIQVSSVPATGILRSICYGNSTFVAVGDGGAILTSAGNAVPIVTASGGTTSFAENAPPVVVDGGITVSDADHTTLASGTVSIIGGFQAGQDELEFIGDNLTMGNITGSYNSTTGTLSLISSGAAATLAEWNAALQSVKYVNNSDNPSQTARTISFTVSDGTSSSTAAAKTVSVTAVNDAPAVSNIDKSGDEDAVMTFTENDFTSHYSDAAENNSLSKIKITGLPSGGSLMLGLTAVTSGDEIPAASLGNLKFVPAADWNGTSSFTWQGYDGMDYSGNAYVNITINPINDQPDISASASISVTEDVPGTIWGITFSDTDSGSSSVDVTMSVPSGTLAASSAGGVTVIGSGTHFLNLVGSIADINSFAAAGQISYITSSNDTSNVTMTVSISDGGNTGAGGPMNASGTVTILVMPVNDAPAITSGGTASFTENGTSIVYTATGTDPDSTITWGISGTDAGIFTINSSGELTFNSVPDYEAPMDSDGNNSYSIIVTAADGTLTDQKLLAISVIDVNEAPSITSGDTVSIAENDNEIVYTAVGNDPENSITWSISGADAAVFGIDGSTGVLTFGSAPDYEAPADADADNVYNVTVAAYDGSLTTTKELTITVANANEAPTDITLSATSINTAYTGENAVVGTLGSIDPDSGDTWTYSLVTGTGSTDNSSFNISGNSLRVNSALLPGTYEIRLKTVDNGGLSYDKAFTVNVVNLAGKALSPDTDNNNVDNDMEICFTADTDFTSAITGVFFNGHAIETSQYTVDTTDNDSIALYPGVDIAGDNWLRKPATGNLVIKAAGYDDSIVSQTISHGTVTKMSVTRDITAPSVNGGRFSQQPKVALMDQYGNICTNDNSTVITASKKDSGPWTLTGTNQVTVSEGEAAFIDLGAENTMRVSGAQIAFNKAGFAEVSSCEVTLPGINVPAKPTITSVTAGNRHVELSWDMVTGATGYRIYSSTTEGDYSNLEQSVTEAVYSYDVTGLANGTTYYFAITATNDGGESEYSDQVSATPQVPAPGAPVLNQPVAGDRHVQLNWNPVEGSTGYIVFSRIDGSNDQTQQATVSEAVYGYDVTGLDNGTMYWFCVRSVNPGGYANSAEKSAIPRTVPGAPTGVTATAGNGQAVITFTAPTDNGGSPIVVYRVLSSPGNITAEGPNSPITVTGLTNGTEYTFTVTAVNSVGSSAAAISNAAIPRVPSDNHNDNDNDNNNNSGNDNNNRQTTPQSTNSGAVVLVNGNAETAGVTMNTTAGGKTVTTVVVDSAKIEERLNAVGNGSTVTIPVGGNSDAAVGVLSGQTVKNMENKEAVLEIKTGNVTYTIPASEINIDDISARMGEQVALRDINVNITVAAPLQNTAKIIEGTANRNNYQIVVKPVEFEITCTSGGKTINVSKFNEYVERMVAIPDGIDPSKITTGVVLNNDVTFSHVPTSVIVIDGKYYAKINSLTNSTYSVIWNPKTFKDVENHWAKNDVNDMGSRLVIEGNGKGSFEPDREITRGEFAAVIVKGLGLMRTGEGKDIYSDVKKTDWYYDAVYIANEYHLINGMGNGKFEADRKITREEAMAIISRAMTITKLDAKLGEAQITKVLEGYKDAGLISNWARSSVAACTSSGIAAGSNGSIKSGENITRAETAAIIRRLLIKSKLI